VNCELRLTQIYKNFSSEFHMLLKDVKSLKRVTGLLVSNMSSFLKNICIICISSWYL